MFTAKSFLGLLEKLAKTAVKTRHVCLSVNLLPLERFSWNFISEYLSKLCQKSSFISLFAPNDTYPSLQGAGFDSQTTQNMRQPITDVLAQTRWSFCAMFLSFCYKSAFKT
jgi:hypothetical protein